MSAVISPRTLELTTWESVSLTWLKPFTSVRAVFLFISGALRSKISKNAQNLHWRQRLVLSFLQSQRDCLSPRQRSVALRTASTGARIRQYCLEKNLPLRSVTVSTAGDQGFSAPPAILHFITPPGAPETGPTVYYAHGGGYVNPIQQIGHVATAVLAAGTLKARQVVMLEYSLAPEHPYPSQLVQVVSGFQTLLNDEGVKPSEIVAMGDSAGGHLVGSLLTHIAKPSPHALPIDLKGDQLRAAVLISPWVSMTTDQASFDTNEVTDFLGRLSAERFKASFAPKEDEPWTNLVNAPDSTEVWDKVLRPSAGLPVAKKVLVVTGAAEVLFDSNVDFGIRHLKGAKLVVDRETDVAAQFPDDDYVFAIGMGEAHTQNVMDAAASYTEGNMSRAVEEFLKRV
ncbi:hypothetical protein ACHAQA_005098 [Verticillium albo-atrum]